MSHKIDDETYAIRARRVAVLGPGRKILHDGAVIVRGGRVAEAGPWRELSARCPASVRDLGEATLLPGLINAHTHLELSHTGLPPETGLGFLHWVRWLVAQPLMEASAEAVDEACAELARTGTAGVADIATRHPALVHRRLALAGMAHVVQFERFGYFSQAPLPDVPSEHLALAGHALYSTAPETLRRAKQWDREQGKVFSLHLAEHLGEVELLADGGGEFAAFMRERILPEDFAPPGLSPTAWADSLGLLDERTLAVHGVHVSKSDIDLLRRRGSTVCLCPRSNAIIGVGSAPVRAYLEAGVPCCLGTDSLASAPDLDLFGELRELTQAMELTLDQAASMLCAVPARLLGFAGLGSLGQGAPARFAVLPPDLEDILPSRS